MHLTDFGTVALPQEDQRVDLPMTARNSLLRLPGGGFDLDGATAYLQSPTITIHCEVVEEDVDALASLIYREAAKGRRLLRGIMRNGTDRRQTWAKLLSIKRPRRPGTLGHQPLDITLIQDYPYWLASEDEPFHLNDGRFFDDGEFFDSGNREEWDITTTSHNFTINNNGDVIVPRGLIVVEPQSGADITNLRITNDNDLTFLNYTGTLSDGDWLSIDILEKAILKNGDGAYGELIQSNTNIDWMLLYLDDNSITVTCDSTITGTTKIYWAWARHYP
jgi:hypothetical protein